MECVSKTIFTEVLQVLLSLIFLLQALIKLITRKLERRCPCHRHFEEELEKERNASAIAVEQAMAMISRLQKEKASLEMDARLFRRTAEQRQLYDLQTINFLKEVVLKLEMERYAPQRQIAFTFPSTQVEDHILMPKVLLHRPETHHCLSARLFE
ncbi:myosin-binding protein 3 isoform X2 [Cryptomeria japonica]|uniref:myosin-binding protein 3 isoform X2 n=1 Tax=Cryptomeria japonica TaxID=3369 RepID=UPI0025ABBE0C|nr:myosin-binding protein 3 isoform X2 [Cryptomeria japonica]